VGGGVSGKNQRLELTWIGKSDRPKLEPRIMIEEREKSHFCKQSQTDIFDNRLIHADNLLALKALGQEFSGKIKCIYIDPPFNTQQALQNYDDGIEHSLWLSIMRESCTAPRPFIRKRHAFYTYRR
jgi:adenine-specific DNA-methyltransferase